MSHSLRTRLKKMEIERKPLPRTHVIMCKIGQLQQDAIADYHATHPDFDPEDSDNTLIMIRSIPD